jgi:hypothetical protein
VSFDVYFFPKEGFHIPSCLNADFFYGAGALSDDNTFLRIALNINDRAYADDIIVLLE